MANSVSDKASIPSATNCQGYVESTTRHSARGWVWMPSAPESIVQVEAVLEGRIIGRAMADQLRPDLLRRNLGTGRYGFVLSFDEALGGERAPTLRAIVAGAVAELPGRYELPVRELGSALAVGTLPLSASSVADGYVEKMTRQGARGWAWSPSFPDTAVQVEAELDGKIIGSVEAKNARLDLSLRDIGTGNYGFVLLFDTVIVGEKAPTVFMVGPDGRRRLHGSYDLPPPDLLDHAAEKRLKTTATPGSASRPLESEGHVDSLTRRGARGWAWLPSAPNTTVEVEAVFDGRVVGRASADGERSDLLARGLGTGRYGFAMSFAETIMGNRAPEIRVLIPSLSVLPGVATLPPATEADLSHPSRGSMTTWSKEHGAWTSRGPHYEEFDRTILANSALPSESLRPMLMAFYLPQFHPIPENNQFWGTGFTEWRQLTRGVSRFPGHYQPRIPRDLGFYDLTQLDTLRAQTALAKAAGVNAFSYYYYWFNGKRLLERPLDMLLGSDVDMPFTILWANENWTRTWDGSESEVLVRQDYRQEDESALLADLARHFVDARYIRLNGRPLFFIYNPANIPDTLTTVKRWRGILAKNYGVEPLFFMAQTFGARDPKDYGFDGAMEFPPHKTAERLVGRLTPDAYSTEYRGHLIAYDDFVAASLAENEVDYHLIKTAVPSWDNESRRPNRGLTLEGLSPAKYEAWLRELLLRAIKRPIGGTPIVAINAWNEWAEAAYLEPDVHYGASYLNATARAYASVLNETTVSQLQLF